MPTRTAKGTAATKTSGTTLTISGVTVPQGHSLVVGIVCETGQGAPDTVTHNGRTLRKKGTQNNAPDGINNSVWLKGEYNKSQTGDIVATWGAAIGARTMVATSWDWVQKIAITNGKNETTPTTQPGTGATVALSSSDCVALCYFGANGPVEDHGSATARIQDASSWQTATIGQQAGTTGGSDVTIVETYLELTSSDATRGQLQSATSREWASQVVVSCARIERYRQGITTTDLKWVDEIVETAGGDPDDIVYLFDEATGQWSAYETTTPGTLRATRADDGSWS